MVNYFQLCKQGALDLVLNDNKGIVDIILEDEYEESNYEETTHMMESSSISLGNLQGEEFVLDNENKEINEDWVLPITQTDMIYKKIYLSIKE